MQHGARSCLALEVVERRRRFVLHLMEQFGDFTRAERQLVEALEIGADASNRQAQRGAEVGNKAGDTDAEARLPEHDATEV
ncbi:MAG: hypothetical protein AVDCRST_MAG93-667 [uncultured Chloroflexia bacterium]|uniref:Uncharacterized protein n=1 Tax=uncultured Chloroflexia bacterium TaxID=1672391 RepID=A0A6J4HM16_9CHLR|nr:MAG: hypothetical protein AVDCRST_MAG93-667 [uncultured Chloroflexia bacterium]